MTDIVWLPWFEQEGENTELLIGRSNQRYEQCGGVIRAVRRRNAHRKQA